MAKDAQTWKAYAGRDWGGDHYHVGDILRHGKLWLQGGCNSGGSEASSPSGIDDGDRALLDLKVQRDQLVSHRRRMESNVKVGAEAARNMVKEGKNEQAMLCLRKKKQHEQMAVACQSHVNRLEELICNIEFSKAQKEAVDALAEGVKMLKRVQKETGGADYINRLMDERDEVLLEQQEINDALAGAGIAADDADALAEYERLIQAQASPAEPAPAVVTPSPAAPTAATVAECASGYAPAQAAPAAPVRPQPQRVAEAA